MRCVNIDWLEVYCEESAQEYPCNPDYFRKHGYFVRERDYGTRVYDEMFFIQDRDGNDIIEIRRKPASGGSTFTGLTEYSTHIRLTNWVCYQKNCVELLRDFLVRHNYIFHRIFRIDICYDFFKFDSGDRPDRVAKRILEKTYLKINQGRISVHGADNWATYEWETLSWGSPSSMVSTKMYNKTKELMHGGMKKPYIMSEWFMCGLSDSPSKSVKYKDNGKPEDIDIWRIEFSIKSKADSWLQIENSDAKRHDTVRVPHTLSMFDDKDKLWQRFQDLAHHYFRFKIKSYKGQKRGIASNALATVKTKQDPELQRKDRMPDKVLFDFNKDRSVLRVQQVPKPYHPDNKLIILRRRLIQFKETHLDPKIHAACQTILDSIDIRELYNYTTDFKLYQVKALQAVMTLKMQGDQRDTVDLIRELEELYKYQEIW